MTGLQIKFEEKVYVFSPDMKVFCDGQSAGSWTATVAAGDEERNGISFLLNSEQKHFVPVTYAFNTNNQLTLAVADIDGGILKAAVVYNGAIDIDDNDDVIYRFLGIDSQPSKTNFITVYGKLSLAPGATHILIDLINGGSTKIKAAPLLDRVLTGRNVDKQPGNDFVSFRAATRNRIDTGQTVVTNANITFTGKWDIQDGKLTFLSQIEGTGEGVKAALVFKGTFGPVTVGFQFSNADGDPKLSFVVKGEHRWSEGDATWNLSLGHSKQEFIAEAGGQINIVPGEGQTLKISGDLKIVKRLESDGTKLDILPTDVKMNLNIAYRLDQPGRCIIFDADLSKTSTGGNYNLFLAGTFQVRGGQLFFAVKFSNAAGAPEFSTELKFTKVIGGTDIAIDLLVSDKGGRPSYNFNISLTYVDGVPVRSDPTKIP